MLIVSPYEFGDKALNPEEAVIKLREENNALVADRRIYRQDELEDMQRSSGPRMDWRELIRRLQLCNIGLLFKDGSAGNIAVYAPKTREEIAADDPEVTKRNWYEDHKYVAGFPKDLLPEYGYVETNERGLPTREVRGWRSVLLGMLKANAITYEQTITHFGLATGKRSSPWYEQTRSFRNNG